ncbi:MAG: hypothetical protein K2P78_11880 [Gemmataceae bacterium]|nr:hypothetical protein [Gemmataceae bacterium]
MTPTRRSLVLAAAFLGLAVTLAAGRPVRAQQPFPPPPGKPGNFRSNSFPQPGDPFGPTVSPDQAREAFRRLDPGIGKPKDLPPDLEKLVPGLTQEFRRQFPDLDPGLAEPAVRQILSKPELQNLDPRLVDSAVRRGFRDPEVQERVRETARQAKANPSSSPRPSGAPKSLNGEPSRTGPPPDFSKALPTPEPQGPSDGGKGNPFDRPGPGKSTLTPNNKGEKDEFPPPVGPPTPPRTDPIPEPGTRPEPPSKGTPEPGTKFDPGLKFGPGDKVPKSQQGEPANPGPTPVPQPGMKTPDAPPSARPEQPPPKLPELGDGFRPPGSPDPNEKPEDVARRKRREAAAAMWEKSVGPLDETPSVKRALFDLVEGTEDFKDSEGNSFWDNLSKEGGGDGPSFADWVNDSANGDSWKLDFGWGNSDTSGPSSSSSSSSSGESWWSRNFGSSSRSSSSSSSSSSSGGGFGFGGGGGLGGGLLPLLVLGALIVGGLLLWKFLYFRAKPEALPAFDLGGLGAWPVDPRAISTREELVKAFEYLSVMICGRAARMWTHGTIAVALADLATTHSEAAMILARLYELARYAPLDEPLSRAEIEESRRLVCRLAGVSYP